MTIENLNKFKNRECKAKELFEIVEITKDTAYEFIKRYHYLKDAKFFSMYAYGLYDKETNDLCGCATYSLPQGTNTTYGWFGLPPNEHSIVELSRLCVLPQLNNTNATSYLLGNSIKLLKSKQIKAVITLANAIRHVGSIYQVCNFKYYGLCNKKDDFYALDGRFMPRGKLHNVEGVWLQREPKHRYAYILDKTLKCKYQEQPYPKVTDLKNVVCCDNTFVVKDNRYNQYYTCPKCTKKMVKIDEQMYNKMITLSKTEPTEQLKHFINNYITTNYPDDSLFEILD